jgi:Ca-activated chloride channel family protein
MRPARQPILKLFRVPCLVAVWAIGLAVPVASQAQTGAPADQTVFQSVVSELVVVPVTVKDGNGRFVPDLAREHFRILDNGRLQDIALFSSEDSPVSISIVIDNSGSMRTKLAEVVLSTLTFIRRSNPEDEIFVVEFNDRVRDMVRGPITPGGRQALEDSLRTMVPQGRTALYDGVLRGLSHLDHAKHARSVLLLISDGGDNGSTATLDDVRDRAQRSNVTIYTVGLFNDTDRDRNPGVLKELAESTGGMRFLPEGTKSLLQTCETIAHEIRSGYLLAFVPTARDGQYHRLRVRLEKPGAGRLRIRTRPGYFAAGATAPDP